MPPEKNLDRILDLILGQLEQLNENQEKLSESLQATNVELTKVAGLKHAIIDIKEWKENIERTVNPDDLKKIKDFYSEHQDINADIEDLYLITSELRKDSDDYKKFKTRALTIITVISFLFTSTIAIVAAVAKFNH